MIFSVSLVSYIGQENILVNRVYDLDSPEDVTYFWPQRNVTLQTENENLPLFPSLSYRLFYWHFVIFASLCWSSQESEKEVILGRWTRQFSKRTRHTWEERREQMCVFQCEWEEESRKQKKFLFERLSLVSPTTPLFSQCSLCTKKKSHHHPSSSPSCFLVSSVVFS
jgi:hypothetical protein